MRLFGLHNSGTVNICDSANIIGDIERLLPHANAFQKRASGRVAMLREECRRSADSFLHLMSDRKVRRHKVNLFSLRCVLAQRTCAGRIGRLLRGDVTLEQALRKLGTVCGYRGRPQ